MAVQKDWLARQMFLQLNLEILSRYQLRRQSHQRLKGCLLAPWKDQVLKQGLQTKFVNNLKIIMLNINYGFFLSNE